MWEQLKKIQENMYGDDKEVLIYTYKNIGVCYLGLGMPDKAEESYKKALDIIQACQQ
jgi:Tfp pilus assembly protein PilF